MQIIQAACYVEGGELNYIISIATADDTTIDDDYPDGSEKIVCNNTVYDDGGGTGIPSISNTAFYTMYKI